MLNNIKSFALAAGVSTLALVSAAQAETELRISEITVKSSVSAEAESNGLELYPNLAEDIRAQVAERVPMSSDGADPQIQIDLRKIALNGATMLPDSKEFNQLEGVVDITSPTGNNAGFSFPVKVTAESGDGIVPVGYVTVLPSDAEFYVALVSTFADVVAEGLNQVNTSGDGVDP